MTDLIQRVKGALYFVPLIIGTLLDQPYLNLVVGILQAFMCFELAKILAPASAKMRVYAVVFFVTALIPYLSVYNAISYGTVGALILLITIYLGWMHDSFRALFAGFVLLCLVSLSALSLYDNAVVIVVSLALIITACDVTAYFIGRLIGGPKLAPVISPGKTISGAIGGLLGAALIGAALVPYLAISLQDALGAAIIIGIFAQAGDLYESAFKRRVGIKDSSQLIPGHGGFLDRFDGYIFVAPLMLILFGIGAI